MKGAFNNEEAIGALVVARQLHQHYAGKSRSTVRKIQRERHARAFYHVGKMCDLPMRAVRCVLLIALSQILMRSWWGSTFILKGPHCHCCSLVSFYIQFIFSICALDKFACCDCSNRGALFHLIINPI